MGWVRLSAGALRYAGKIKCPDSFGEWADTEGKSIVNTLASRRRFSLFSKRRSARRELWRELSAAARGATISRAIQMEIDAYLKLIAHLAYVESLPRAGALRRLVAVPRVLLNSSALRTITQRLGQAPELAELKGGASIRDYFCLQLVTEIDGALVAASPSVRRPVRAEGEWVVVGLEERFVWLVPFRRGPDWRGHYFVYEPRGGQMTRVDRKDVVANMRRLAAQVAGLSRIQRDDILSRARS